MTPGGLGTVSAIIAFGRHGHTGSAMACLDQNGDFRSGKQDKCIDNYAGLRRQV